MNLLIFSFSANIPLYVFIHYYHYKTPQFTRTVSGIAIVHGYCEHQSLLRLYIEGAERKTVVSLIHVDTR